MEADVVAARVEQDKEPVSLALRIADVKQEYLGVRIIPVAVCQNIAVGMMPGNLVDRLVNTVEEVVVREPQGLEYL